MMTNQNGDLKDEGLTIFEIEWNSNYAQLVKFKKRFGHCCVPQAWPENKVLGRWVIRQRVRKPKMTKERIEKLNKISFVWNTYDAAWDNNLRALVRFKKKDGHCNVSKGDKKNKKLADWVGKQRKDRKKNEKRLTEEKIKRLDEIGFDWEIYTRYGWDNQYKELLKFKRQHGHSNVPRRSKNNSLSNWVAIQRRDKSKLSSQQVKKLGKLGFSWSIKPRKNKKLNTDQKNLILNP